MNVTPFFVLKVDMSSRSAIAFAASTLAVGSSAITILDTDGLK